MIAELSDNPKPVTVNSAHWSTAEHYLVRLARVLEMNLDHMEQSWQFAPIQCLQLFLHLSRFMGLQERIKHRIRRRLRIFETTVLIIGIKG